MIWYKAYNTGLEIIENKIIKIKRQEIYFEIFGYQCWDKNGKLTHQEIREVHEPLIFKTYKWCETKKEAKEYLINVRLNEIESKLKSIERLKKQIEKIQLIKA
jgi:hypothetical protein